MPRTIIPVLVLAAGLIIAGTAGCLAQPTVTVQEVRVGTFTPANTTLQVRILVANPNAFDIPLRNIAFTVSSVEAGGIRRLGEGQTGAFTLPARQSIPKTVPVTLDNEALLEAALAAVRAGQDRLTVRVSGTVTGDVYGVLAVNVPFEQDQTITFHELLGMAGVPVTEEQVRQALGAGRAITSGGVPAVTVRIG